MNTTNKRLIFVAIVLGSLALFKMGFTTEKPEDFRGVVSAEAR